MSKKPQLLASHESGVSECIGVLPSSVKLRRDAGRVSTPHGRKQRWKRPDLPFPQLFSPTGKELFPCHHLPASLLHPDLTEEGSVCAKIVNGGGTEYTACLHRNGSHSCDCKAGERGVLCYHVRHLQAKEAERQVEQHVEKSAPAPVETKCAEKAEKVPVPAQTGKDRQRQAQEAATAIVERMQNAPLTGNKPFRLMR